MSIQIAVRLPEDSVAYIDRVVAEGRATSRADVVARAIKREHRREIAAQDVAIFQTQTNDSDLDALASYAVTTPVEID